MNYSEKKYGRKIVVSSSPTYTDESKKVKVKRSVLTMLCILFLIIGFVLGCIVHSQIIKTSEVNTLKGGEHYGRTN